MMDNRTIIAIVLIILLWSGYSLFFSPQNQTQTQDNTSTTVENTLLSNEPSEFTGGKINPDDINNEINLVVSNELYEIQLSSIGASIKNVKFKKYTKNSSEGDPLYLFDSNNDSLYTFLTFGSEGIGIDKDLNYVLDDKTDPSDLNISDGDNSIIFTSQSNGLTVEKKYTFHSDSYHIDVDLTVNNVTDSHFSGKLNFSLNTPWYEDTKGDFYSFTGPLSYAENKLHEDKPKSIVKNPKIYKDFIWTGFTDKYFLQAVQPNSSHEQLLINYDDQYIENKLTTESFYLPPSESVTYSYKTYVGPKNLEHLSDSNADFDEAIHFGFFHFLSKPLFDVLRFFNSYINNYGFSIILLTVCIKLIFWPLTHKSYKSMQGMQKLQPEMKRLKEKYANDKQRLNQEMMSFYRDNKVNPLGGCLPILIQIPVFFALYRVLLESIELRHAPFILWITDLSAKDPYFITPIVMGASMFLQQKLTPTNLDPTQEKVMLMMPVIFTFMFLNFPAGLVIYWLVNNLLTILQQLIIRRQALKE